MFEMDFNVIYTPPPEGESPYEGLLEADASDWATPICEPNDCKPIVGNPCLRESSDHYSRIVAQIHERWRVIEGACGIQWILQYRQGGQGDNRWQGKSFWQTKGGLELGLKMKKRLDGRARSMLDKLPDRFPRRVP